LPAERRAPAALPRRIRSARRGTRGGRARGPRPPGPLRADHRALQPPLGDEVKMKIEIIHLYRHFEYSNMGFPIALDVLKSWAVACGWEASVRVAREAQVDVDTDADVVAISTYTQCAPAAYRLSRALRARGRVVILGGPHFRGRNWREAVGRCDVVVNAIC